jgi:hypothetical protein
MSSELQYQYSILRYEHDVRTEEFLNVGVFFWVPEDGWCDFLFTEKPNRVLAAFPNAEKNELISVLKEIRSRFVASIHRRRLGSYRSLMKPSHMMTVH